MRLGYFFMRICQRLLISFILFSTLVIADPCSQIDREYSSERIMYFTRQLDKAISSPDSEDYRIKAVMIKGKWTLLYVEHPGDGSQVHVFVEGNAEYQLVSILKNLPGSSSDRPLLRNKALAISKEFPPELAECFAWYVGGGWYEESKTANSGVNAHSPPSTLITWLNTSLSFDDRRNILEAITKHLTMDFVTIDSTFGTCRCTDGEHCQRTLWVAFQYYPTDKNYYLKRLVYDGTDWQVSPTDKWEERLHKLNSERDYGKNGMSWEEYHNKREELNSERPACIIK